MRNPDFGGGRRFVAPLAQSGRHASGRLDASSTCTSNVSRGTRWIVARPVDPLAPARHRGYLRRAGDFPHEKEIRCEQRQARRWWRSV
jgi:hypothetical protein